MIKRADSESLERLEDDVRTKIFNFEKAGLALATIRQKKLYRSRRCFSFHGYVKKVFDLEKGYVDDLINGAQISAGLHGWVAEEKLPRNLNQAIILGWLRDVEDRVAALELAWEQTMTLQDKILTIATIKECVLEVKAHGRDNASIERLESNSTKHFLPGNGSRQTPAQAETTNPAPEKGANVTPSPARETEVEKAVKPEPAPEPEPVVEVEATSETVDIKSDQPSIADDPSPVAPTPAPRQADSPATPNRLENQESANDEEEEELTKAFSELKAQQNPQPEQKRFRPKFGESIPGTHFAPRSIKARKSVQEATEDISQEQPEEFGISEVSRIPSVSPETAPAPIPSPLPTTSPSPSHVPAASRRSIEEVQEKPTTRDLQNIRDRLPGLQVPVFSHEEGFITLKLPQYREGLQYRGGLCARVACQSLAYLAALEIGNQTHCGCDQTLMTFGDEISKHLERIWEEWTLLVDEIDPDFDPLAGADFRIKIDEFGQARIRFFREKETFRAYVSDCAIWNTYRHDVDGWPVRMENSQPSAKTESEVEAEITANRISGEIPKHQPTVGV